MNRTAEAPVDPVEGGRLDVVLMLTLFAVFINVGKPQELFGEAAAPLRLGLVFNLLALFATLLFGSWRGVRLRFSRELVLIVAMTAVGALTVPLSVWPGGAFREWFSVFPPAVVMVILLRAHIDTGRRFRWLIRTLLAGIAVLVLGTFVKPVDDFGRISTGLTYDANDIGLILVCAVPLLVSQFVGSRFLGKVLLVLFGAALLIALLRTGSRGALLGLALTGLYFLVRRVPRVPLWQKVVGIGLGMAVIATRLTPEFVERITTVWTGEDYNVTGPGRLQIWKNSLDLASQYPLGAGVGQFGPAMGAFTNHREWLTAHNSLIQVAVEMGLLGLVVFLWMLFEIWRNTGRVGARLAGRTGAEQVALEALSVRIMLFGYFVSAMFLSQAYFLFLPMMLAATAGVREAVEAGIPAPVAEAPRAQRTGVTWQRIPRPRTP